MSEEILYSCCECNSHKSQLIRITQEEDRVVLLLLCMSCGNTSDLSITGHLPLEEIKQEKKKKVSYLS